MGSILAIQTPHENTLPYTKKSTTTNNNGSRVSDNSLGGTEAAPVKRPPSNKYMYYCNGQHAEQGHQGRRATWHVCLSVVVRKQPTSMCVPCRNGRFCGATTTRPATTKVKDRKEEEEDFSGECYIVVTGELCRLDASTIETERKKKDRHKTRRSAGASERVRAHAGER